MANLNVLKELEAELEIRNEKKRRFTDQFLQKIGSNYVFSLGTILKFPEELLGKMSLDQIRVMLTEQTARRMQDTLDHFLGLIEQDKTDNPGG